MSRIGQPLRQQGAHTKKWARWMARQKAKVMGRSMRRCEACGALGGRREWHHSVGRSHLVSEPWASLSELCFALCAGGSKSCHHKVTYGTDLELTERLRQKAADRLAISYGFDLPLSPKDEGLDRIREMIRKLEADGWAFDPDRQEIVKPD
jgi:hypothetical protein